MSYGGLLTQTARVFKGTTSVDSSGEEKVVWSYQFKMPCVVEVATQYALLKMGIQSQSTHKIYTGYIAALFESPRQRWRFDVLEGTADPANLRTYVLVEAKDPMRRGHHLEIAVRRLDEEEIQMLVPQGISSVEQFGSDSVA